MNSEADIDHMNIQSALYSLAYRGYVGESPFQVVDVIRDFPRQ
jgi:hypothetical protein